MPWYGSHPYLNQYIREHHCRRIMEVGVYTGKNAVRMVEAALKNVEVPEEVEYYGFDFFANAGAERVGRELEKLGCTFKLFAGDTLDTLPGAVALLPEMDLIFIDGGKSFREAKSDWEHAERLVHDGTAVYVHNADMRGVRRMLDQVSREMYEVDIFWASSEGRVALIKRK